MAPSAPRKTDEGWKSGVASGCVLVTGASAGIGRELARAFASRGRDLVLLARSREATTELARELVAKSGVNVKTIPADLSLAGAAEAIFESVSGKDISVDILVNNAGVLFEGDFSNIPLEDHLRLLQINVVALTALTRLFLPAMLQRRRGRILNVASTSAFMPVPRLAAYAAAKAYILSLTESLAEELRGSGVTATALCPGFTDTAMMRGSRLAKPVPSVLVMAPAAVAEQGCAACLAGETICVPGLANKLIASGTPLLPRKLVRVVGGLMNGGGLGRIASAWRAAASPSDKEVR
jgi:short-subunit dehydrogenase